MALVLKDRVKETTTTTGTGTITLAGAVSGFQSFSVIGNANTTYYSIVDSTAGTWEVGIGTYTSSGTTLSRDTVLESSNSGSLVNFGSGTKDVFCTYPAERSVPITGGISLLSDQANTSTGYLSIPSGTTAQRPASPTTSMVRYNTTESAYEVYNGSSWKPLSIGSYAYSASYLIIGGGGGGGSVAGGGGGAGGLLSGTTTISFGTSYSFVIGAGGAGKTTVYTSPLDGSSGSDSTGFSLTAIGGGGGGAYNGRTGLGGGSGGGGGQGSGGGAGGAGTSGQGNNGASGNTSVGGGGGGGAGGAATNGSATGGSSASSSITGSSVAYAGGGGGGGDGTGGSGGGGGAGTGGTGNGGTGTAASANSGSGGGGAGGSTATSGSGGSGVVILSVPTASYSGVTTGSPSITTSGSNTIIKFTSSGSYTG